MKSTLNWAFGAMILFTRSQKHHLKRLKDVQTGIACCQSGTLIAEAIMIEWKINVQISFVLLQAMWRGQRWDIQYYYVNPDILSVFSISQYPKPMYWNLYWYMKMYRYICRYISNLYNVIEFFTTWFCVSQ